MNKLCKIFIIALTISICFQPILSQKVERKKRDLETIITIVAELGPPVYNIIRELLLKKKCGKKIDPDMVNNHYNSNMDNAQQLKDAVSAKMAEAGNAIHMKASGYNCDDSYCEEMGPNATGTLGICSKQYCVCNDGVATMEKCGLWRVYDPMINKCTWTSMRTHKCIVPYCTRTNKDNPELGFFCLPAKETTLAIWVQNLGIAEVVRDTPQSVKAHFRVCALHFDDRAFQTPQKAKLNRGAVPRVLRNNEGLQPAEFPNPPQLLPAVTPLSESQPGPSGNCFPFLGDVSGEIRENSGTPGLTDNNLTDSATGSSKPDNFQ